ncbi:MAG: hypothetical protein Nk1A_7060 [Endomicrobiia bacterium]|nr:MAG: hypothetical protein Nk1A_7060 [Endomicrobiia bacterium]
MKKTVLALVLACSLGIGSAFGHDIHGRPLERVTPQGCIKVMLFLMAPKILNELGKLVKAISTDVVNAW